LSLKKKGRRARVRGSPAGLGVAPQDKVAP